MACFVTPSQGVLGHFSEAPWGPERRYLGHISCSLSHMEMIFGTILKYSKADYMHKNWQHFIKKHKSYAVLTVSGLSLAGGRKGPSTTFQNSVIIARWERITWFLLRSLTHTRTHFTHFQGGWAPNIHGNYFWVVSKSNTRWNHWKVHLYSLLVVFSAQKMFL